MYSDNMTGSCPTNMSGTSNNTYNSDISKIQIQHTGKTVTKFPPLRKNKIQEFENNSQKSPQIPSNTMKLQHKQSSQQQKKYTSNTQLIRKPGPRKKTQKKKELILTQKPYIIQKYESYQQYLQLLNLTNNLKVIPSKNFTPYTLYVGKGNNSPLIKSLFRINRPWWKIQQTNQQNPKINLFWYQLRQNQILQLFKEVNKNEEIIESQYFLNDDDKQQNQSQKNIQTQKITNKINIRSHSLIQKQNRVFAKIITKRSSSRSKTGKSVEKLSSPINRMPVIQIKQQTENQLGSKGKKLINPKMWPVYQNYRKLFSASQLKQLKKIQAIKQNGKMHSLSKTNLRIIQERSQYIRMHNHCENNWNLSNKKALFLNMKNYYEAKKIYPFDYIPITFHVQNVNDKQFQRFLQEYERKNQQILQQQKQNKKNLNQLKGFKPKKRNAWLVKPGENTNRGIGIQVVQTIQQIKQIIQKQKTDKQGRPRTYIIQNYIIPFLYQKRKFDIRSYICITSVNGCFKGYWYQDGYIRTACKQFNMKNLTNKYIHLTNDAVQKKCQEYGKYQTGNKLSFSDFQRYLDASYNHQSQKYKFWNQAYPEMKKIATDAICAVYSKIDPNKKQFTFQIFGLDFLIDENFKVWLIEANTNPCLQLSSPLLARLIPSMLQNTFRLTVDPIFPPPTLNQISSFSKKLPIPQNMLQNNRFELVFDQKQSGKQLKTILTNSPTVQIFNIEQQQQEYEDQNTNIIEKDKLNIENVKFVQQF